jgi:D-alanyl-D-alanine carboxypeptidase/D-alanyl-D-alanine-endopeptidase (penicillin-binding protein 4)
MTRLDLSRRALLAGIGASLAAPLLAEGDSAEALVAAAKLTGTTSFLVADAKTGRILEARNANALVPPASVAKTITSLFVLEHLRGKRRTEVWASGAIVGGRLKGDLILKGGGDPTLDTDHLGDLVAEVARKITAIEGRFLVHAADLPALPRIAEDQPVQAGYDAGLSALTLNFNRVSFEWDAKGTRMVARGERFAPEVTGVAVRLREAETPLFTYADKGVETWTVARSALRKPGSRWLPLRRPADHAAEVFLRLAAAQGLDLPAPLGIQSLPQAKLIAAHESVDLPPMLRDMLRWSTNVTAETLGLAASGAADLRSSGALMSAWAKGALGIEARFVDHSGLGAESRVTAAGLATALMSPKARALRGLLKEQGVAGPDGKKAKGGAVRCFAKSGTLNFVSGLAGYIERPQGDLVFAIFSADPERRAAVPIAQRDNPPGEKAYVGRARALQTALIARWALMA